MYNRGVNFRIGTRLILVQVRNFHQRSTCSALHGALFGGGVIPVASIPKIHQDRFEWIRVHPALIGHGRVLQVADGSVVVSAVLSRNEANFNFA